LARCTVTKPRRLERAATALSFEREPVPRGWLHIAVRFAERGSRHEATPLRKQPAPKVAREDLVVAHVCLRPRHPAGLREHKSSAHRDDLALWSGRTAPPQLLARVYRAVPPQECRIRRLADPKQRVAHFHEFGRGGLCLLQPLAFLPPPAARRIRLWSTWLFPCIRGRCTVRYARGWPNGERSGGRPSHYAVKVAQCLSHKTS
jgi:hypothetical protein